MVFFLIFPQNMHCGCSLGPPDIEAVLKSKHNPCFIGAKDCVPKPSTVILMTIYLGPILVSAKRKKSDKEKKRTYKQVCHRLPSTKAVAVFGFILKRNKIT